MKRNYNFIAVVLLFMLSFSLFAQEDADISKSKIKKNEKAQLDTRFDNMGYWNRMIDLGVTKGNPSIPFKPAVYKGSFIEAKANGVKAQDSPDVPVTSATNVTQTENSIFIDPNDNQYVLNSNNSTSWTGSSVGSLYGANYFQSADGGAIWGGSASGAGGANSGDPAAAINLNGRQFVGYISSSGGMGVSYSDNGSSWTPVTVYGTGSQDKNHLWVDNAPSSPYQGNLYNSWVDLNSSSGNYADNIISRSTNNGVSWSSVINISSAVNAGSHNQGVNIQTGPNGEVYAVWAIYDSWPSDETALGLAKSVDGGASFAAATRIISNIKGIRDTEVPQNMRVNSFPVMAVDISGGSNDGNVYVVWTNVGTPGVNSGTAGVYMIRSTNGGTSWSTPVKVNQGTGTAYQPWITCDSETGTLAVVYYDNRNTATADAEAWVSYSFDTGATWTDIKVSDVSFTPTPISGLATGYMGDYLAITSKGGRVYPCWADNRGSTFMTYVSPFDLGLTASFTANNTNICTGSNVTFTDQSSGSPTTWTWSFPGGSPSSYNGQNPPTITYNTPGTYNVSLIVGDGSTTNTETKTGYITVENIIADFSASTTTVVVDNTVTFTDNSACGPTGWNWTFPGGNPGTATGSGPHTITYNTIGTYDVTLAVTSGANNDTETKTNYIDVINCNYCTTSYSNTSDDFISNVSFNSINNSSSSTTYSDFTGISTNVTTGNTYGISADITVNGSWIQHCWVWIDWNRDCDFDDAGEGFDLGQTPGTSGIHTLSVNIPVPAGASLGSTRMRVSELYNADPGPCTVSTYGEAEDYTVILQSSSSPPIANFAADITTPAVSQTVNFTDMTANSPTSWSWSFNPTSITYVGGTNSSSQNPQVQFNAAGYYTVTLIATNGIGSDSETKTNYIFAGTAGNWTGAISTDWNTADNWENLMVPTSSDDVTIPASAPNWPTYSGNFELGTQCLNIILEGSSEMTITGDLTIPGGNSLSCNANAIINVGGDWNDNGTFTAGSGTVNFYSAIASDISAGGSATGGGKFDNADGGGYYTSATYIVFDCYSAFDLISAKVYANGAGNRTFYWSNSSGVVEQQAIINVPDGESRVAFNFNITPGTNLRLGVSSTPNLYRNNSGVSYPYAIGTVGSATSSAAGTGYYYFYYDMEFSTGTGVETYNNLVISKNNNTVTTSSDIDVNGDFTIKPGAYFTNNSGNTLNVSGNATFEADASGNASYIDNGTSTFSNNTLVESYISEDKWHMVSAPITNAQSVIFVDLYLMEFNEPTYDWTYITPLDFNLTSGRGFMAWSASSSTGDATVDYSGPLNNGNINVSGFSYTVSQPILERGWNMVGNPYPSAINWNSNWGRTNIDATAYIYDGVQYVTWNGTTGTHPNGDIAPGQGFFVKANASGASLLIPQGERKHSGQGFYKEGEQINELLFTVDGNGYSDKMIIQFTDDATAGFDSGFDAWKFKGKAIAPQMYSVYGNNDLTVNALPFEGENMMIPINFENGADGEYFISVTGLENLAVSAEIWLEDIFENKMIDLNQTPLYSFEANQNDEANRFLLHFGNPMGIGDVSLSDISLYSYGAMVYIQKPAGFEGHIRIFDMLGQEIVSKKAIGEGLESIKVTDGTGYYLVKVQSGNKLVTEKVLIR